MFLHCHWIICSSFHCRIVSNNHTFNTAEKENIATENVEYTGIWRELEYILREKVEYILREKVEYILREKVEYILREKVEYILREKVEYIY